jgi:hypothetical protein
VYVGISITGTIETHYQNWKIKKRNRRLKKEYKEYMQRLRKREEERRLYREEREKYPLFYWRELTNERNITK